MDAWTLNFPTIPHTVVTKTKYIYEKERKKTA